MATTGARATGYLHAKCAESIQHLLKSDDSCYEDNKIDGCGARVAMGCDFRRQHWGDSG